jgi:signal transduction histidine kinase
MMKRFRLWRSTPFRLAITFSLVFVMAFVISGFVTYQLFKQKLEQSLDRSIGEMHVVLASTYAPDDIEDLVSAVNTFARLNKTDERIFSVTDATGRLIAGNFAARTPPDGLSDATAKELGLKGEARYRLLSGKIGDKHLVVGQSFNETNRLEDIAYISFAWSTVIVLVAAIVGGVALAARAQARLDGIAQAMAAVSHGNLEARVPLAGNGDDIDTVSRQINEALERLSVLMETMRQVSSDIAHELKTPLNRLKMQVESAVSGEERGEPVTPALLGAREEADRINATFEALLRISQIEAGARKSRFRQLDLSDLMLSIAEIYIDVAEDNGQVLTATIDPSRPCWVHGDRELLMQMFVNLIENSIRHCPTGTHIALALHQDATSATATVSDDGPGIPADERDKVFRRLYRLDKSRTTSGSGLGLSLVRAIADLHGGKVAMHDNAPGLRAEVVLPLG